MCADTSTAASSGVKTAESAALSNRRHSNETHGSTTDLDARLARKSGRHEAKLAYTGNAIIENRNGLVVCTELLLANGTAERNTAMMMVERLPGDGRVTMAGDRGYDTGDFVQEMRAMQITPHVAQNTSGRRSAIDGRTTRHAGYGISQQKHKRIKEVFGWLKPATEVRQVRHRGPEKVAWIFTFAAAAYNLIRMRNLSILCKRPDRPKCLRTPKEGVFQHGMRPPRSISARSRDTSAHRPTPESGVNETRRRGEGSRRRPLLQACSNLRLSHYRLCHIDV